MGERVTPNAPVIHQDPKVRGTSGTVDAGGGIHAANISQALTRARQKQCRTSKNHEVIGASEVTEARASRP
ncbi:hypothetical protein [Streptomyces zagrosensis]|uniref:Uncharacterized protein n=1 Tax=Streptomyces zagrosensis TaxID=1042984 RepID=A0A7W9Q9B9_9ACTN|nr:hypothetical protein [Streptomyces zagrosensis]MBB5936005.1 hypothetical protein [Streptomyces zagrosensis]